MPQRDRAFYEGLLNDPRARAMLDLIAAGEVDADGFRAGNGYDALFGRARAKDLSQHPNQASEYTDPKTGKKRKTTAAGRYQFLYSTWTPLAKRLGLTDFSARSQDIAALALADEAGALDHFLEGRFSAGVQKLGDQWASMPDSKWRHGSTHSPSFFYDVYTASLRRHDTTNKYQVPEPPTNYRQTDGGNIIAGKPYTNTRGNHSSGTPNFNGGPGGGRLQLNTTVDMSKIPDMSNWDPDNYTAQMMFNRYGNRRLLATRPGQWSPAANTLLSAALLEPKPPVLYSPLPFPEGQVTVMTQDSGNRASPAVQPVPVQPPQPAQEPDPLAGGPTFYPEQSEAPLNGPMFTLEPTQQAAQQPAAQQQQRRQQTRTQGQATQTGQTQTQAQEQSTQTGQTEQPTQTQPTQTGQTTLTNEQLEDLTAATITPEAVALLRDMGLPPTGTPATLPYEYLRVLQDQKKYLDDNMKEYEMLMSGQRVPSPETSAFKHNYETRLNLYHKVRNGTYNQKEAMDALQPYMQTAPDFTGQQVAAAERQMLLAELNPFAGMMDPVTQDLERLALLNTPV